MIVERGQRTLLAGCNQHQTKPRTGLLVDMMLRFLIDGMVQRPNDHCRMIIAKVADLIEKERSPRNLHRTDQGCLVMVAGVLFVYFPFWRFLGAEPHNFNKTGSKYQPSLFFRP